MHLIVTLECTYNEKSCFSIFRYYNCLQHATVEAGLLINYQSYVGSKHRTKESLSQYPWMSYEVSVWIVCGTKCCCGNQELDMCVHKSSIAVLFKKSREVLPNTIDLFMKTIQTVHDL